MSEATGTTRAGSGWTAGRVLALVFGSIFALLGVVGVAAGGTVAWAAATQRDDDGYIHTDAERFSVGSYAITSDDVDLQLGADRLRDVDLGDFLTVRIRATPVNSEGELFVGIARAQDVATFLRGVEHDVATDLDDDPFHVEYVTRSGEREATDPGAESIWVEQSSGSGRRTVTWEPENGMWTIVVMNADASRGVDARIDIGASVDHLWWIVGGLLAIGAALLALGIFLIVRGSHARHAPPPTTTVDEPIAAVAAVATEGEPVVLAARLDEPLSRWLWLVKWLLAIPHYLVLAVLWIVTIVLTIIAGIAILFTGRYPRGIFDFNLGVLRWTWRVGYYAAGAMGTDRYPPFSLDASPDYPATLDVAYPGELSRGLVLVKWWLLAIPHYVIIGIIGSGWWWGNFAWGGDRWSVGGWGTWGGGLLGILVLIAAVRLLFTARYPRDMFGLIVGLNRWVYRVLAYVLLMTDRYPPFHLDQESRVDASSAG
ncbi:MAG: DUF4389 domain-containing protein [Acidimicrobiia bacterium]